MLDACKNEAEVCSTTSCNKISYMLQKLLTSLRNCPALSVLGDSEATLTASVNEGKSGNLNHAKQMLLGASQRKLPGALHA
jgi:hypothetical protein